MLDDCGESRNLRRGTPDQPRVASQAPGLLPLRFGGSGRRLKAQSVHRVLNQRRLVPVPCLLEQRTQLAVI